MTQCNLQKSLHENGFVAHGSKFTLYQPIATRIEARLNGLFPLKWDFVTIFTAAMIPGPGPGVCVRDW